MFVGHFAVALAAKTHAPRVGLPALFGAVAFLDILFPVFVLTGIEHAAVAPGITKFNFLDLYDYPYSHSLVFALLWSVLFAALWFWRRQIREAVVVAFCVFSHFVLDVASHRPDVQLWPGSSERWGLGLWNSVAGTLVVEGGFFAIAIWLYLSATRATRSFGTWGFWGLVALLTAGWLGTAFGPPPPSITAVVISGLAFVPIVLGWSWGLERARASAPNA